MVVKLRRSGQGDFVMWPKYRRLFRVAGRGEKADTRRYKHNGQKHSLKLIWNFNDKDVSADEIASVIVQDLKLPQNLEQDVLLQIQKPLQSH